MVWCGGQKSYYCCTIMWANQTGAGLLCKDSTVCGFWSEILSPRIASKMSRFNTVQQCSTMLDSALLDDVAVIWQDFKDPRHLIWDQYADQFLLCASYSCIAGTTGCVQSLMNKTFPRESIFAHIPKRISFFYSSCSRNCGTLSS